MGVRKILKIKKLGGEIIRYSRVVRRVRLPNFSLFNMVLSEGVNEEKQFEIIFKVFQLFYQGL